METSGAGPSAEAGRQTRGLAPLAALVALSAGLALYVSTAAPGVQGGDSGEFQFVGHVLGIPHPPGYPLYAVLGKVWTLLLPVGEIAYRMNLLSAAFAAATLAAVAWAGTEVGGGRIVGFGAGLAAAAWMAVSPTWWSQATVASVRPATGFFVAAVLAALATFAVSRSSRWLYLSAFLAGLGVTHHISLYTLAPAFAVFVLVVAPRIVLDWRVLARTALAGVLPLLVYAYLPIRSAMGAPFDASRPTTLAAFVDLVTARGFAGDMLHFNPLAADRLELGRQILQTNFGTFGVVLALLGGAVTILSAPRWALLTGSIAAINLAIGLSYRAPVIADYLIPTYVVLALWIGRLVWLASLLPRLAAYTRARIRSGGGVTRSSPLPLGTAGCNPHAQRGVGQGEGRPVAATAATRDHLSGVLGLALAAALILPPFGYAQRAWAAFDLGDDTSDERFMGSAFTAARPGATILADWHHATILWYGQLARGERPDVTVTYVAPEGPIVPWLDRAEEALERGPVYTTRLDREIAQRYHLDRRGELYAVLAVPHDEPPTDLVPPGLRFGDAIDLVGHLVEPTPHRGHDIEVTLAWRARDAVGRDYREFVHLTDASGRVWGQRDGAPGEGVYPTSRWRAGETIAERYGLSLAPTAPAGEYLIRVGLYEVVPGGWRRLEARAADGRSAGDAPIVGRITLAPRPLPAFAVASPPTPPTPLQRVLNVVERRLRGDAPGGEPSWAARSGRLAIPLGHRVLLSGWAVDRDELRPGQTVRLALDFLPLRRNPDDLAVFVHLVDAAGALRAQHDSVPVDGGLPTLRWAPGRPVRDIRTVRIPRDLPPGDYTLRVGMYVMATGAHLPVLDEGLAKAGQADHVVVAQLRVRP